jgi:hypothetical protein
MSRAPSVTTDSRRESRSVILPEPDGRAPLSAALDIWQPGSSLDCGQRTGAPPTPAMDPSGGGTRQVGALVTSSAGLWL